MSAPKACPHAPVELKYRWLCTVCGHELLRRRPIGPVTWWTERRQIRRQIEGWRNG